MATSLTSRRTVAVFVLALAALTTPRAWSRDTDRITFAASLADNVMRIYVTTSDGAHIEAVTPHDSRRGNEYPVWSRDGRTIVYSATPDLGPERLYLMDADGGNTRAISDGPNDWRPTWSSDDKVIAFSSGREGMQRSGVYIVDLDTGLQTRLTPIDEVAGAPSWRPGGGAIAYTSDSGGFWDLHIMDERGRHLAQLTDTETGDATPVWHPREDLIAFAAWDTVLEDGEISSDIHTIRADGRDEQRVTKHPARDSGPQWSPNGREILFTSRRDGDPALFITDVRGRSIRRVTDDRFVRIWGSSWFDAKFPRAVSPVGKRGTAWGWLKRLGAPGR